MRGCFWAVAALLCVTSTACSGSGNDRIPSAICGTRVDPSLTGLLVAPSSEFSEFNRVDRSEAMTAPCALLARDKAVLGFRFSWNEDAPDLVGMATQTGRVSRVSAPRAIEWHYKTIVGTDGAISQTPCRTKSGNYFTLTLQLPQIKLTDQTHRKDIEKFMRAYFPATVRTLGCAR
ncbi:hypothetical protein [Streptomyces sp. NPDC003688]